MLSRRFALLVATPLMTGMCPYVTGSSLYVGGWARYQDHGTVVYEGM